MWYPLRLKLNEREYLWGRESSCDPEEGCLIENGEFGGMKLSELIDKYAGQLLGDELIKSGSGSEARLPFRFKNIETKEALPVRVIAGKGSVSGRAVVNGRQEGGLHKLWYVIEAKADARLALGLGPDQTAEKLWQNIDGGSLPECLGYSAVKSGDVYAFPAGLVYGGGRGLALAEIEAPSSQLYTLYDYGRIEAGGQRTPLSVIKGLAVLDCGGAAKRFGGLEIRWDESARKVILASTRFFAAELYIIDDEIEEETDGGRFVMFAFTEGEAIIEYGSSFLPARCGDVVLIPAALGEYGLKGKFKALKVYVPAPEKDTTALLKKAGYSAEEIKKNVAGIGGGG